MDTRPIIGITMGDPAGNGPELTVKALARAALYTRCRPLVIGDARIFRLILEVLGDHTTTINAINHVSAAKYCFGTIDILHEPLVSPEEFVYGRVCAVCGMAAFLCVKKAIALALSGEIDATCTNAINKEALSLALAPEGLSFAGHTEIYAEYTKTKRYTMLLAHKNLRVVHVSTHCSLREACDRVKKERVLEVIQIADRALRDMGIENPRIAVCGLNPHAGENGLFGQEELFEIIPAVTSARALGINAAGPIPPDSVFPKAAAGLYDIVVAMYHDQGHIPIKTLGFRYNESGGTDRMEGVNITLGLPIIRTSVDHGTGFELAWKGLSCEGSLVCAIDYAIRLALVKAQAKNDVSL